MDGFSDIWQYMPHGMCLLWQPWLVVLWAGSDLLIFLSYFAIPVALITVLRKRKDVPERKLVVLFASFIMLCGLTHLFSIITLWVPIYPQMGLLKLATGIVSAITAVVLFRLIPDLISFPSPQAMSATNQLLVEEIEAHEATLASLEEKVEERTRDLNGLNAQLAVQAREAVHRSSNLLAVVSSLASESAEGAETKDEFVDTLNGRIRALARATSMVMHGGEKSSEDFEALVRDQLAPLIEASPDRIEIAGPAIQIGSEAAQQLVLAIHELATNAQKYSLPVSKNTKVRLEWNLGFGENGEDVFRLRWSETPVAHPGESAFGTETRRGFGTKLLTRIVPTMLRGEAHRAFADDTFLYELTAPVSAVLAAADKTQGDGLAARLVDENFGEE